MELDAKAVAMVQRYGNLPRCLWVPVAARDIAAITRYVGVVEQVLAGKAELRAIVVRPDVGAGPGSGCPLSAPVWRHPESAVFHAQRQVWVHVDYGGYLRVSTGVQD